MNSRIKLIAETAWHHEGNFDFIKKLVSEIVVKSKADFLKFHLSIDLDEYMDKRYPIYDTLKSWMLNTDQWNELITETLAGGKDIMLLFNDQKAIDFGMKFHPKLIEIHSVALNDVYLLEKLKDNISSDQKVVLGIGGSDLYEIENAIETLAHDNIVLMFGFQNYPTKYEDINLDKVRRIKGMYPDFEFGYADHTAWNEENNILITLLGAATGMQYVEKHVTNIIGQQRCDWQAAVTIDTFNEIADKLKLLEALNGNGLLKMNEGERKYSVFGPMKKAAILTRDVNAGEIFSLDMITFKRTGDTSDYSQLEVLNLIGTKIIRNLDKNTIICKKHLT